MKTRPGTINHKQTGLLAVQISSKIMSATNISELLLQNINEPLPVETHLEKPLTWVKSLSTLPIFTRREIDLHVKKCGKLKGKSISKTSLRGRLFKLERFLSSDSIYTAFNLLYFYVKARCKASMKKELRNVRIQLYKRTGEVYKATCSCPAGKSGYCNHVIALLYEIAEHSLNQLTEVPQEKACTSVLRKWGVPGNKEVVKETVMRTTLTRSDQKKGIPPTLYDARLNFNEIKNVPSMLKLKSQLCKIDKNIGFAHVIPDTIDINFSILSNLDNLPNLYGNIMEQDFPGSLPVTTLDWDFNICEHGSVSKHEFTQKLKVTHN